MQFAKRFLKVVAVLLLLPVLLLLVLRYGVDAARYRTEIQQRAAAQGIGLVIAGDLHWSLLPRPALAMSDIVIDLPAGDGRLPLHVGEMSVVVKMSALLHGDVVFDALDITQVTATLAGQPPLVISDAAIKARQLNSSGQPFPVSLSLHLAQGKTAAVVQASAQAGVDVAEHKFSLQMLQLDADVTNAESSRHVSLQDAALQMTQRSVQLEAGLTAGRLLVGRLLFTDFALKANAADGTVNVSEFSATAYQGKIHGNAAMAPEKNATPAKNGNGNRLTLDLAVDNLQLAPFLIDLQSSPSGIVAGALKMDAHISAKVGTSQPLIKTASGNAQLAVAGLVLDEMNLEQRVCEAAAGLDGKSLPARQWSSRTELRAVNANASINSGIMFLSSLQARMDNITVTGQGVVSPLDHALDIPMELKLVSDSSATNFCPVMNPRLTDIAWPLRCKGNYVLQKSKDLCGVDQSRMDKLIIDIARKSLEKKLEKGVGESGDKLKKTWRKLFD